MRQSSELSHEVISAGWWPGSGEITDAAFYCYAAPQPPGFDKQPVGPEKAFYHSGLGEFVVMYEDVRHAATPSSVLMEFLESTYAAGATAARWDRNALELPAQPATGVV